MSTKTRNLPIKKNCNFSENNEIHALKITSQYLTVLPKKTQT